MSSDLAMRPGRSSRVWNDDEEVIVKALKGRRLKKDDIYPTKLISPAQLEKLDSLTADQKDKLLKKYVTEKAGKLKLTKVAHNESSQEVIKDVEQCSTNSVDSSEMMMFGSAAPEVQTAEQPKSLFPEPEADAPASTDEVSFF